MPEVSTRMLPELVWIYSSAGFVGSEEDAGRGLTMMLTEPEEVVMWRES